VGFGLRGQYGVDPNPLSVAVGVFRTGSGLLDIATANSGGSVSVLLGHGDGTFEPAVSYPAGANPHAIAVGDFNGDGNADLVVANTDGNNVSILLGNGDGTFRDPVNYPAGPSPVSVAVADFNGDGVPDLVVANHVSGGTVSVLLGDGNGGFLSPRSFFAGPYPSSVAVADFNGDGSPDVAVANNLPGPGGVSVLLGNGDGSFGPPMSYQAGPTPVAVAVGDFDGDGTPDLAVADQGVAPDYAGSVTIFLGNGNGTFQSLGNVAVGGSGPRSVAVGDFDLDGNPDLVTANRNSNNVSVLLGRGDGRFRDGGSYDAGPGPSAVAVVDNYSYAPATPWPDVVVADAGIPFGTPLISVLMNTCAWPAPPPAGGPPGQGSATAGNGPANGLPESPGHPQADLDAALPGGEPVAVGGAHVRRPTLERAAALHPGRTRDLQGFRFGVLLHPAARPVGIRPEPILAPFPRVAVDVE
jgi:hypothetical protein